MSNIILTQTPTATTAFLYPNGDNTTGMSIYPTSPSTHYDKVDEPWTAPDDDAGYVYCASPSTLLDLLTLQDHTIETGTINYIQVLSRARASMMQAPTGEYRHKITCGIGNALSMNYGPLTTSYQQFSTIWPTNPATGVAWTWSDIDSLLAGVQATSPLNTYCGYLLLRPNAAGAYNEHYWFTSTHWGYGTTNNYTYIDDEIPDEGATFLESGIAMRDYFNVPNHTTETWNISDVTLFLRGKLSQALQHGSWSRLGIYHGTSEYQSGNLAWTSAWNTLYNVWATCPWTSAPWTWTNIDDMQIGFASYVSPPYEQFDYTQLYAVINYYLTISPDIRTTQLYIKVNYIPASSIVTLLAPDNVRLSNTRRTERFIFPDGSYRLCDYGRASKTLSMTGTEQTNAILKMRQLQAMSQYTDPVTISGLLDINQDASWRLRQFNFDYDIHTDSYAWAALLTSYDEVTT